MHSRLVIHHGEFCIIQANSAVANYVSREITMQVLNRPWGAMHYRVDGPAKAPTVVFANSLGTDLRLWDPLLAEMPEICAIRFD
jgi:3-oxoadipate enol-lactonase